MKTLVALVAAGCITLTAGCGASSDAPAPKKQHRATPTASARDVRADALNVYESKVDDGINEQDYLTVAALMRQVGEQLRALAQEAAVLGELARDADDCAETARQAGNEPSMDVATCQGTLEGQLTNFASS